MLLSSSLRILADYAARHVSVHTKYISIYIQLLRDAFGIQHMDANGDLADMDYPVDVLRLRECIQEVFEARRVLVLDSIMLLLRILYLLIHGSHSY
jgi:hypothetical protein